MKKRKSKVRAEKGRKQKRGAIQIGREELEPSIAALRGTMLCKEGTPPQLDFGIGE